jgi:DNA-binding NarL/FixJ family response regulator
MNRPIRVVLADDHTLFRVGIRSFLEKSKSIQVVAEAGDGEEAVACVIRLRPDLILMDISMPHLNGIEAAIRIRRRFRKVRILILSMYANEEYACRALQVGANGYLLKDAASAELEKAILEVCAGHTYLTPSISWQIVQENLERLKASKNNSSLTPTQRQVLQLIVEGHTTREIAEVLRISPKTADSHRTLLMKRLDLHDVAALVRYAIQSGMVPPGP